MNPIANIPIFLALVQDADKTTKERINKKATTIAFLISVKFIFGSIDKIHCKFLLKMANWQIPTSVLDGLVLPFPCAGSNLQFVPPSCFPTHDEFPKPYTKSKSFILSLLK